MAIIQCPHCQEEVELGIGAFGLFDCPHCNEEFAYKSRTEPDTIEAISQTGMNTTLKVGFGLLFASLFVLFIGVMYFYGAINDFNDSGIDCESDNDGSGGSNNVPGNPFSLQFWGLDDCSNEGDYGLGSLCCSCILMIIGVGVGISALVSLVSGSRGANNKVMIIQQQK